MAEAKNASFESIMRDLEAGKYAPVYYLMGDEPYYPVFTESNKKLYQQYLALAREKAPHVIFGGRLGLYKYLDMDDAIAEALKAFEKVREILK